jgi:arylsulfatase A-like enzyme
MFILLALLQLTLPAQTVEPKQPDILVVVMDDVGLDYLEAYRPEIEALGLEHRPTSTPTIDALAAAGTRYRYAWAHPLCSPARASLLTGRHCHRTGICGLTSRRWDDRLSLAASEVCIPEALPSAYATAMFGKWHLANALDDPDHPRLVAGFDHYDGLLSNIQDPDPSYDCRPRLNYTNWTRTKDGTQWCESGHHTEVTATATAAWIVEQDEPWFAMVSFSAAHTPLHDPYEYPIQYGYRATPEENRAAASAMISHMDEWLSVIFLAADWPRDDLLVIVTSDNGSAPFTRTEGDGCWESERVKNSIYEGGIRVPLLVCGSGFESGAVSARPALLLDIFGTACMAAGVPVPASAEDSIPLQAKSRTSMHSHIRMPVEPTGPWTRLEQAVAIDGWKLHRYLDGSEELYQISLDQCEGVNLWPPDPGAEEDAYAALSAELVRLGL